MDITVREDRAQVFVLYHARSVFLLCKFFRVSNSMRPSLSHSHSITFTCSAILLILLFLPLVELRREPVSHPKAQPAVDKRPGLATSGDLHTVKGELLTTKLPLAFEANVGQVDGGVKFLSRQNGSELFLTNDEAVLYSRYGHNAVRLKLAGANPVARVRGIGQLPGYRNYFIGNDAEKWQTNVPTFSKVLYEEIYPQTNLIYYGNETELEYDFELAPGADPGAIRLSFERHVRLQVAEDGGLIVSSRSGKLIEREPIIYQEVNGHRQIIQGRYILHGKHEARFEVVEYDSTKTLVIDTTLVYSTYLGGAGDDSGSSIALDASGNIYVKGSTTSVNFTTKGGAFLTNKVLKDVFVMKLGTSEESID